MGVTAKTPSA